VPTTPAPPRRAARPRRAYHHGDLPRALREAAKTLVARDGADGFTLREAARLVGVNHAAAYRHFADKRALLADLATAGYDAMAVRMRAAAARVADGDGVERVHAVALAYVRFGLAEPALFGLMTGPRLNADGRFPGLERALEGAAGVLEAPLGAAVFRRGTVVDRTLAVLSLAHGYVALVLARRIHVKAARVPAHFRTLLGPLVDGFRAA
jgi:AcrR family transcriptional regulator